MCFLLKLKNDHVTNWILPSFVRYKDLILEKLTLYVLFNVLNMRDSSLQLVMIVKKKNHSDY